MDLRPTGNCASTTGRRLARLRPAAALLSVTLLALALFAGRAQAGTGDYPSPLYLSGPVSSLVTSSFTLIGTPGPSAPTSAPTVATAGAGALTGTYSYVYTLVDSSGETESPTSLTVTTSSNQVSVGSLPTGLTVRIYRKKSTGGPFYRVAELPSNASSTYTDNLSDAAASANPALPEAENRVATAFSSTCAATTCGYTDFSPGFSPATSTANTPTLTASASTTPNGKGWIVDGPGGVFFPAGTWTFQVRTKSLHSNGVAHLVVGLWKVTTSGGAISSYGLILDPNSAAAESSTNLVMASGGLQTITHSVGLPSFSLAAGEHLYVQFWRRQTGSYSTGSSNNRLATMLAYDGIARTTHPGAYATPPPAPPGGFSGVVAADGLTLRWTPPPGAGPLKYYVLYVDGVPAQIFGEATYEAKMGPFDSGDARTFALAAVDQAGNTSPLTETLVGVPDLAGLTPAEADAALGARGLVLGDQTKAAVQGGAGRVVSQTPAAPSLAAKGSPVSVVVSEPPAVEDPEPLVQITSARRVSCVRNSLLRLDLKLAERALVTVRFLSPRGALLASRRLGPLRGGAKDVELRLPPSFARPARYWVIVTAIAEQVKARTAVRLVLERSAGRSGEQPSLCRAQ